MDQRLWEVPFTTYIAALVSCLAATEAKVIYIPDCRELMKDPVSYVTAAILIMLFAWGDSKRKQRRVMTPKTLEEINAFVKGQQDVILVVDQLNALEKKDDYDEPVTNRNVNGYRSWWRDRNLSCVRQRITIPWPSAIEQ
jgi:hypothetical protein